MSQIICKDLSVGYNGKEVIGDINFSVEKGDYICIIGENGSGKSTLMRTLLNLIPPVAGEIVIGDGLMRNEIGYLPQQTVVQKDFPASVREIVLSGCLNHHKLNNFYTRADRKMANEMLEKLQISHLAKRCYRELSGGQQQRVLLARALCATTELLILDEPVAGLDPDASENMYDMIYRLNQDEKITVIMVSHDMDATYKYASHILHVGDSARWYSSAEIREEAPAWRN